MYCPNCGVSCPENANFCPQCGLRLPDLELLRASTPAPRPVPVPIPASTAAAAPETEVPACADPASVSPADKHGAHWIPLSIMALLAILGLILFFAMPFDSAESSETPRSGNVDGALHSHSQYNAGTCELIVPEILGGQIDHIESGTF